MAIKKAKTFKGIELNNAYHKITSTSFTETWSDEKWKLYQGIVTVNSYTDETKDYDLEQKSYIFKELRETENTLERMYILLSKEEDFNWGENV